MYFKQCSAPGCTNKFPDRYDMDVCGGPDTGDEAHQKTWRENNQRLQSATEQLRLHRASVARQEALQKLPPATSENLQEYLQICEDLGN